MMTQAAIPDADAPYGKFAVFLDHILTLQEKHRDAAGKPLAVNFRDMDHFDAAIREALGSDAVVAVLKKHGMRTFVPEGGERGNAVMEAFRRTGNEEEVRKAVGITMHALEPAKAAAYRDASTALLVTPQKAGINVVFNDARYNTVTPAEDRFVSLVEENTKSVDCAPMVATAALSKLKAEGMAIDMDAFTQKISDAAILNRNALNTLAVTGIGGRPANFYTLQGAAHSDMPEGNPQAFARSGYNVADIALAPAEESRLRKSPVSVLPQYFYSFRTNEGYSGRAAQEKYLEIQTVRSLTPEMASACLEAMPADLQEAFRNSQTTPDAPASGVKAHPSPAGTAPKREAAPSH